MSDTSSAVIQESGLRCPKCEYNLTGLTGDVCPECGTHIDWDIIRNHPELVGIGTPAHRATGLIVVPMTFVTATMALITPWVFARRVRPDESLKPAFFWVLLFFVRATSIFLRYPNWRDIVYILCLIGIGVSAMAAEAALLSTLTWTRAAYTPRWTARWRIWFMGFLYTSCFFWCWFFVAPIDALDWSDTLLYWPFATFYWSDDAVYRFIILWWWSACLVIFAFTFHRRQRWVGVLLFPFVLLLLRANLQLADGLIFRLSR